MESLPKTSLEQLRARINAEIDRRLMPAVLTLGEQYHYRRKLRQWCSCPFCQVKRQVTASFRRPWINRWYFRLGLSVYPTKEFGPARSVRRRMLNAAKYLESI